MTTINTQYGYDKFVKEIEPIFIYSFNKYIKEQQKYINEILNSLANNDAVNEEQKKLNFLYKVIKDLFGEKLQLSYSEKFKDYEIEFNDGGHVDPDNYLFYKLSEITEYALLHNVVPDLKYDLNCICNYLEMYFRDDSRNPNPFDYSFEETTHFGMKASKYKRERIQDLDDEDIRLEAQLSNLEDNIRQIKIKMFEKSIYRILLVGYRYAPESHIKIIVNQLQSLWV